MGFFFTVGGTAVGYALGKTGGDATAQDNGQLEKCASGSIGNAVDGLIQAVQASGPGVANAVKVDITLEDGHLCRFRRRW